PPALDRRAIAALPVVLGDQIDELAVAVVLRHRIRAARVHAAWDLAVPVLVGAKPLDEVAHLLGMTEAQERGAGQRAVADPRALVGARSGLDRRPVAVDEDEGELRAHGVRDVARRGRQLDRDAVERAPPALAR